MRTQSYIPHRGPPSIKLLAWLSKPARQEAMEKKRTNGLGSTDHGLYLFLEQAQFHHYCFEKIAHFRMGIPDAPVLQEGA